MKSIRRCVVVLSTAFYLFLCIKSAHSSEMGSELDLELKPMFAMNFGDVVDGENFELKDFYHKSITACGGALKKYDSLLKTVNIYIQRYVNLFLAVSGHLNEEKKESDDLIIVNLEIRMSPEDLAYLQYISKATDSASSALKNLYRLESIMSKVVANKRSVLLDVWRSLVSSLSFLTHISNYLLFQSPLRHFTPLLTILLVVCLMYTFLSRKSFYVYLSIIINSLIFWESLILYWTKIKEADIEYENLKLNKIADECHSQKWRWYDWFTTIFTGDRCFEYQKRLETLHLKKLSLFKCILETYGSFIFETPVKILGASIRGFTEEISALWPTYFRWILNIPLIFFSMISVFLFILVLCRKRLRLSFFNAALEVGDATVIKETKIINMSKPRLESSRSLNVLGKSRLLKRVRMSATKNKPSILAPSESQCASESEKKDCSETAKKEN